MKPIVYANTRGELIRLQWVTATRSKWTYLLFALMFFVVLPGHISSLPDDTTVLVGFLTVLTMQALVLSVAFILGAATQLIATLVVIGRKGLLEHTVTFDSETITEQTSQDATVSRWSGVHKVGRTQDLVFIYLTPVTAHVIPRRAVTGDWDVFFNTLQGYWQAARA